MVSKTKVKSPNSRARENILSSKGPQVSVIMGSQSDWSTLQEACEVLEKLHLSFEVRVLSAHRTPNVMIQYAQTAKQRGIKVIIAGAGGAAHLPGMVAANTALPVIGVPVVSKHMNGIDSLYSIVQMPFPVPVGTMAIGGAKNAAIYAARILSITDSKVGQALDQLNQETTKTVTDSDQKLFANSKKFASSLD